MLVFTSVTRSYLPKARVLGESLKRLHPKWRFVVLLSDVLPADWNLRDWPFDDVVLLSDLGIDNWRSWAFQHSVVELCTAVKGVGARYLIDRYAPSKIMYLDPDICVYASLSPIDQLLDEHSIVLTPHLLEAESQSRAIEDAEICALQHGVFNLGFFAVRTLGQGLEFLEWWSSRLLDYCFDDIPRGLFTDQRWCDLAPCFFSELHILRDPGCNVATWNIAHRRLTQVSGQFLVSARYPLRFYHFTGFDSGDGLGMLKRYASDQPAAFSLWSEYASALRKAGNGDLRFAAWEYGRFDNGEVVTREMRLLYRQRRDLQSAFPNPFCALGLDCFYAWWIAEFGVGARRLDGFNARLKIRALSERLFSIFGAR